MVSFIGFAVRENSAYCMRNTARNGRVSLEDRQTIMKSVTAKRAPERLTPYEAAVKVGLVGCIEGPPDLALNHRKYARRAVRAKYRRAKRAP